MNNFSAKAEGTKSYLKAIGAIDIGATLNDERAVPNMLYRENANQCDSYHDVSPNSVVISKMPWCFPENLSIFLNKLDDATPLLRPTTDVNGVQSHYLLDGASLLPPLMLNVQPGDRVYDACSAPGGKSLLLLQTKRPGFLVCNDLKRTKHIMELLERYLPEFPDKWNNKSCEIREKDARGCREYDCYDRVRGLHKINFRCLCRRYFTVIRRVF